MQTNFTATQLADPATAASEGVLRKCVHCGFCTATCPTFTLLGDELDSPRGRIYLIKDMLEGGKPATAETVKHVDRCLSCLSCMTTCPSGVNYMHLVDHARAYIEQTYRRPFADRALRSLLAFLLPNPFRFRLALKAATLGRPFAKLMPAKLAGMMALAPAQLPPPSPVDRPQTFRAEGARRARVALLTGCAQQVVAPVINEATVRLLTRLGVEVVVARGGGCCGALTHHLGKEANAHGYAKAAIDAWTSEIDGDGLDAIVINASGCGTTIKDYGFMFREDPVYGPKAERVAMLARDITEFLAELGPLPIRREVDLKVAYHSACSMQHGQKITALPKQLLSEAGFKVREPLEGHLCCGSAGTYNLLQPEIATQLRDRKVLNLERTDPDIVATGNVGCITQISSGTRIPVLHTVQLLDWATGGPEPVNLRRREPIVV
ncbi:glycolate oxidase iron-sulfur subunit [Arboricoccus pini]|uniref:Glycolate oxidase iron-sulfur subunit n=1 Tax=Arboricoccus pini TaxID=1963835 RepID=A0A212RBS7_9PROT|nr:glycolate oxidase subunit GlcF [Arboricoccus pini]SNB69667.1 glycolate oxidase iron-sulfur subunit [Arboricoccus pini]